MSKPDQASGKRTRWLRAGAALAVVVAAVVAVLAFQATRSSAGSDGQFLAAVEQQGKVVPTGEQQALLVSAAHKICDRQGEGSATTLARRQTALKRAEIDAVEATFGNDSRAFVTLALNNYCPD